MNEQDLNEEKLDCARKLLCAAKNALPLPQLLKAFDESNGKRKLPLPVAVKERLDQELISDEIPEILKLIDKDELFKQNMNALGVSNMDWSEDSNSFKDGVIKTLAAVSDEELAGSDVNCQHLPKTARKSQSNTFALCEVVDRKRQSNLQGGATAVSISMSRKTPKQHSSSSKSFPPGDIYVFDESTGQKKKPNDVIKPCSIHLVDIGFNKSDVSEPTDVIKPCTVRLVDIGCNKTDVPEPTNVIRECSVVLVDILKTENEIFCQENMVNNTVQKKGNPGTRKKRRKRKDIKVYVCSTCHLTFSSEFHLGIHTKMHIQSESDCFS